VAGRTDLSSKTKKVFFCTSEQILIEDKFCASRQVPFRGLKPSNIGLASSPRPVLGSGTASPQIPNHQLSPAEMQERHAKGLCFNCDVVVPSSSCFFWLMNQNIIQIFLLSLLFLP